MKLREWKLLVQVIRDMQHGIYLDSARSVDLTYLKLDPPPHDAYGNDTTSIQHVYGDSFTGQKTQNNNIGSGPVINSASGPISFGGTLNISS